MILLFPLRWPQKARRKDRRYWTAVWSCVRRLKNTFSRTSPDSELYRVNHRETDTVEISDELAEVIALDWNL